MSTMAPNFENLIAGEFAMIPRFCKLALGAVLIGVFLAACQRNDPPAAIAPAPAVSDGAVSVNTLADELLAHLRETSAFVRLQSGLPIGTFDRIALEQAQQEAKFSKQMLARVDAIALDTLPQEQWLLAKMLRHRFAAGAHAEESYWLEFEVTPYAGGFRVNEAHAILAGQSLQTAADLDGYLRLLDSYALMIEQVAAKTRAQAERNIRVPKPAIAGVLATFRGLNASAADVLTPARERLAEVSAEQATVFEAAVQQRITTRILPGYEAVIALFDDAYVRSSTEQVGISQQPGGKEHYLRLIADYTGLELTPQQIQEIGQQRGAELEQRMQTIRDRLGFKGSRQAFHESLRSNARFRAKSPQDVEHRYLEYLARMESRIPEYFSRLPQARYGVARLALASENGMTYGYYQPPTPVDPVGRYYYNGSDLEKRSLITAQHLIYHELVPGHHFHLALQLENSNAHPVRKFLAYDAFNEGWAEYAASLGEEMNLYADQYDLYGHLLMQAFLTSRLVVDTGMNNFGMSLEEARAYMNERSFESDVQLASETIRYSTDIYAQALSYRLGYEKFWELRHRAEKALGPRFDVRQFHAAAIGEGAMPLDVLEEHLDRFIAQHSH